MCNTFPGQFSTLMKQMNNDKIPPLYRQVVLPQQVSSEKDLELEVRKCFIYLFVCFPLYLSIENN